MPDDKTFDPADAPEGFTLAAEAGREGDAAQSGIVARDAEPEPDDDALDIAGEDGDCDDDDALDEPDDDAPTDGDGS